MPIDEGTAMIIPAFDGEVIYIARMWGYRIQRIPVILSHLHQSKVRLLRDSKGEHTKTPWRICTPSPGS